MRAFLAVAAAATWMLAAPASQGDPAVVIHPGTGTCGVLDADLNFVLTTDAQIVSTQSQHSNITVRCRAKGIPNDTGAAVIFGYENTGLLCVMIDPILGARTTQDWQETLTPSGVATAVCSDRL
jgi:hypothetical protein